VVPAIVSVSVAPAWMDVACARPRGGAGAIDGELGASARAT
jgi:hypothetical protein